MAQILEPSWWMWGLEQGFAWWAFCLLAAVLALPLVLRWFRPLADRGGGLAGGVGIALTVYLAWIASLDWLPSGGKFAAVRLIALLAALGIAGWGYSSLRRRVRRFHVKPTAADRFRALAPALPLGLAALLPLRHTGGTMWLAVLMVGWLSLSVWWGRWPELVRRLRIAAIPFCIGQLLFFVAFVFFVNVRSYIPEATFDPGMSGAEKFGNLMHLSSAMASRHMPPSDAWYGGLPTNYYYGGHLTVATIAKATGTDLPIAFNLGLATIFALSVSLGFSFVLNLAHGWTLARRAGPLFWHRGIGWGLLGACAIALFGNLDAWQQIATRSPQEVSTPVETRLMENRNITGDYAPEDHRDVVLGIIERPGVLRFSEENLRRIDYWRSSRAVHGASKSTRDPGTITEFPYFSAILGDLHAHHMALPFTLLALSAALALLRATSRMIRTGTEWWRRAGPLLLLMGLAIGAVCPVNIWDAVVLAPLYLLAILVSLRGVEFGEEWRWAGFGGLLVALVFVVALVCNTMPITVPLFSQPLFALLGMAAFGVGIYAAKWETSQRGFLTMVFLSVAVSVFLLAAGALLTARGMEGNIPLGRQIAIGLRDAFVVLAAGSAALMWAHGTGAGRRCWWAGAGVAYGVTGFCALSLASVFLVFFESPLRPSEPMMFSVLPPIPHPGLFDTIDTFWREFWQRSPISPFPRYLRTSFWDFMVHWGLFAVPVGALGVVRLARWARNCNSERIFALAGTAAAVFALAYNAMGALLGPVSILAMAGAVVLAWRFRQTSEAPVWVFVATASFFFLFVEVLHFDDNYTGDLERYNTPFKIWYPLWPMMAGAMVVALRAGAERLQLRKPREGLGIPLFLIVVLLLVPYLMWMIGWYRIRSIYTSSAVVLFLGAAGLKVVAMVRPLEKLNRRLDSLFLGMVAGSPGFGLAILVLGTGLLYPFSATATRTDSFFQTRENPPERTLDGLAYLETSSRFESDRAAMTWIRENTPPKTRLLEAPPSPAPNASHLVRESYSPIGRMAAGTGRPTLIGWAHHEHQWRGWSTAIPPDVARRHALFLTVDQLGLRDTIQVFFPEGVRTPDIQTIKRLALADSGDRREIATKELEIFEPEHIELLLGALEQPGVGELSTTEFTAMLIEHAERIYTDPHFSREIRDIIAVHELDIIVIGPLERTRFPGNTDGFAKFEDWEIAFENGQTIVYRVPREFSNVIERNGS